MAVAPKKNKRNIDPWSPAGPPPELQLGRIFYGGVIESPKTCPYPRGLGVGAPQIKAEGLKEVGTPNLGGLRGWDPNPGSLLEVRAPKPWELWGVGAPKPSELQHTGGRCRFCWAGPVLEISPGTQKAVPGFGGPGSNLAGIVRHHEVAYLLVLDLVCRADYFGAASI